MRRQKTATPLCMFLETSQHTGYKPKQWDDRDNRAWKWFVVPSVFVDPFMNLDNPWGGEQQVPTMEDNITVVLGVANPLVWLLTLPAVFFVLRRGIRQREEGDIYLGALFLASYLPLVASPRPIWLNTALSVLPYAILAVAALAVELAGRFRRQQLVLATYLTLVILVASPLYLLAIGRGMKPPLLRDYLSARYLEPFRQTMPAGETTPPPGTMPPAGTHSLR